jgi:hypothetical protein
VLLLGFVGEQVGHNWTKWKDALSYVDYVIAAGLIAWIAYLVVRRLARRRGAPAERGTSASESERQVQTSDAADWAPVSAGSSVRRTEHEDGVDTGAG